MPRNSLQSHSHRLPTVLQHPSRSLSREMERLRAYTEFDISETRCEVAKSAARIRGLEYLGHEAYRSLESLARHEALAASSDPIVADEYAMVRRVVTFAIADEIQDFRRTR